VRLDRGRLLHVKELSIVIQIVIDLQTLLT